MTSRTRLFTLFAAVVALFALRGEDAPNCTPVPIEPTDGVILTIEQATYAPGEAVSFSVDPNGVAIDLQWNMRLPWTIERRSPETGEWTPIQATMPFGCYATDCVDGQPMVLCVDPAPPWCERDVEATTFRWDGREWVDGVLPCGEFEERTWQDGPAPPGEYRVVLHYHHAEAATDPTLDDFCGGETESVVATFEIVATF